MAVCASLKRRPSPRTCVFQPRSTIDQSALSFTSTGGSQNISLVANKPWTVQEGVPTLEAVHRLDRDTTGCLLFAKRRAALEAAIEVFKTHKVAKTYHARAAGAFKFAHMTIDDPIDGQDALSRVAREATSADARFLRIRIETGRTNQIRRHLAGVRAPVLGDRVFGLKSARDPRLMCVPRQMLHASTISMPDPMKPRGEIKVHSPLPADFRATLKLFGMGRHKRSGQTGIGGSDGRRRKV